VVRIKVSAGRQLDASGTLQQGQESFSCYARGADKVVDNVQADLVIARNNQRSCNPGLLQLDVTARLPSASITKLLKDANNLSPI
jgi:hypothetical protein